MNVETLSQLFDYNISNFNKPDLLVYRGQDDKYYNISSNGFKSRVVNFALGLRDLGVKQDTKIVLLSENRPEWHVVDFACHLLGAVLAFISIMAPPACMKASPSPSNFCRIKPSPPKKPAPSRLVKAIEMSIPYAEHK